MTPVSLIHTLGLAVYLAMMGRILSRRPLTGLHWSCAGVLASFALWSLEEIVHGMPSSTPAVVDTFGRVGSLGWGSFASANLLFSLILTHRYKALRSWWLYPVIALPPAIVFLAQSTVGLSVAHEYPLLGWRTSWSGSIWTKFFFAYYSTYALYSLYIVFRFRRSTRRFNERRQADLILTTGLVTLILGTVTDVLVAYQPIPPLPDIGAAFGLFWAGGIYLAVTRYGLMSMTPQAAADDILKTMGDALLLLNPDGTVATANRAARELFGCRIRDLRGRPAQELFADAESYQAALARVSAEDFLVAAELNCRNTEGVTIPVSVSGRTMRDPGGETVGTVWVLRDITLKRAAEERQAEMTKEIAAANQELSSFAYVVSHDLKAPLRAIDSLVRWLATDYGGKFDSDGKEQVELLLGRVKRMHNLIDGILQYSRVGRIREELKPVDLSRSLPEVIDLISPPAHIKVNMETLLPTITAEKTRIEQVFQNLLSNAIKYNDKPEGRICIGCREDGDSWQFYVKDNGPGIEEKDHERIFQIFQTGKPRDQVDSTGVGLAVVKKAVELYGGRIWLESEPGKGSTFFFTYPKSEPARQSA